MGNALSQVYWIPRPALTEKTVKDQSGKVYLVTGGYTGIGFHLCKILYSANATVYIAGRSAEKSASAMDTIKKLHPASEGKLEFLKLDLADLSTIKVSAEEFLAREKRLDVLWNNAGVMVPPKGSKTAQGYELQMGTNCLGSFLFTKLLTPALKSTAASSPSNSVRVCWAGSLTIDVGSPKGGITMDESGAPVISSSQHTNYAMSKTGNYFFASEFGRRNAKDGIVSVSFNPGSLRTELQRHLSSLAVATVGRLMLHPPVFGAYTEIYAGLSEDLTTEDNGVYIKPWGRKGTVRADIEESLRTKADGGTGQAEVFWKWCEKTTEKFL